MVKWINLKTKESYPNRKEAKKAVGGIYKFNELLNKRYIIFIDDETKNLILND